MVDGVLLLVDASRGRCTGQFVLRKTLEAARGDHRPSQQGRPARCASPRSSMTSRSCSSTSTQTSSSSTSPSSTASRARVGRTWSGRRTEQDYQWVPRSNPCSTCSSPTSRRPRSIWRAPLQALVTNLGASPYVGRLALCRVRAGSLRRGNTVAWCRTDGTIERARIAELYVTGALDRVPAEADPGDRGGRRHPGHHDRWDARRPGRSRPLPVITSMTRASP